MRIGYLTGTYPRATDTFIQREVAALRGLGEEVRTYSVRRPSQEHLVGAEQEAEFKSTEYLIPCSPLLLIWSQIFWLFHKPTRYFSTLKLALGKRQNGVKGFFWALFYFLESGLLGQKLMSDRIDHLHNHMGCSSCTVAMLTSSLTAIPYSFTLHGPFVFYEAHSLHLREKIHRAKFVACISNFCRSQAMFLCDPSCWSALHVVHCGIDPALFEKREHTGTGNQLLFVGRLAAAKGIPVLLDALSQVRKEHPDIHLTMVGDGEDRTLLEKQVRHLGLEKQVTMVGYESQKKIRERLSSADALLLPSFAEGLPVVLMEALAAHVPVVTTQIAGSAELVENGISGFLVPPGDSHSFAAAITELVGKRQLRIDMGARGRQKVETEFHSYDEAAKLQRLFRGGA